MSIKVERLRSKASLLRRAASVRTMGAGDTDQILRALADELDRGGETQERGTSPKDESKRGG